MLAKPKGWRDGVNDAMTRDLVAVLDLPQTEKFNREQAGVIFNWIMHAREVTNWTPESIELLRRVARDGRLRSATYFDQIFERNPAVAAALMPDILDMIARDGIGADYTVERQCAYTFAQLDPSLLRPYARRIIELMEQGPDTREILLPAMGASASTPRPTCYPCTRTSVSRRAIDPNPGSTAPARPRRSGRPN